MPDLINYKVSTDTIEQFANISTFAKNMVLKEKNAILDKESSFSKSMSIALEKYYDTGLTVREARDFLLNILNYNTKIEEKLKDDKYKKSALGITNDNETSFNQYLKYAVYEKCYDKVSLNEIDDFFKEKSLNDIIIKTETINNIKVPDTDEKKKLILNVLKEIDGDDNIIEQEEQWMIDRLKILVFPVDKSKYPNDVELEEKLVASEYEKNMVSKGYPLILLQLNINLNTEELKDDSKYGTLKEYITFPEKTNQVALFDINGNNKNIVSVIVVFKEFNQYIRDILSSSLIEFAIMKKLNETTKNNKTPDDIRINLYNMFLPYLNFTKEYIELNQTILTKDILRLPIYVSDSDIILREFKKLNIATNLYKYQYGNPLTIRTAEESDIIVYYEGDNFISNGYGRFQYQQTEIQEFLRIYAEIRNYYYLVLLNDSFIAEEEYNLYEKIFLISVAIERFLSYKIESVKDINSYRLTDIKNFFESYGLKGLSDQLSLNAFFERETIAKRIIKSYVDLVKNKGNRKEFQILEQIFSIEEDRLEIKRHIFTKVFSTKNENNTITEDGNHSYSFIEIPYDSPDKLIALNSSDVKMGMNEFISSDKYWKLENTPIELLDQYNINTEDTKYIRVNYKHDITSDYYIIRTFIGLIDLLNAYTDKIQVQNMVIEKRYNINAIPGVSEISLVDAANYLRQLYTKYIYFNEELTPNNRTSAAFYIRKFATVDEFESLIKKLIADSYNIETTIFNSVNIYNDGSSLLDNFVKKLNSITENNTDKNLIKNSLLYLYPLHRILKISSKEDNDTFLNYFVNIIKFVDIIYEKLETEYTAASAPAKRFVQELFYEIFLKKSENNDVDDELLLSEWNGVMPEFNFDSRLECSEILIQFCEELSSETLTDDNNQQQYSIVLGNIQEEQRSKLDFLTVAIEYFISYTSDIYDMKYVSVYDSKTERAPVDDYLKEKKLTFSNADSFFYDEKLEIKVN